MCGTLPGRRLRLALTSDELSWVGGRTSGHLVLANGLCLYGSDSQREQKRLLRDRLYAEGLALLETPAPSRRS